MTLASPRARARTTLVLGASLAALAIANPALAQNAPPAGGVPADAGAQAQAANPDTAASTDTSQANNEIVVTAQFRAQNLRTPRSPSPRSTRRRWKPRARPTSPRWPTARRT